MSGDPTAFLDTNVLVYAVTREDLRKYHIAREILERGFVEGCYAISSQVLLELYVTITRKVAARLEHARALEYLRVLTVWHVVEVTPDLVLDAVSLSHRARISAWDATILEAARRAGCTRLISEDLTAGRGYEGITVENPFAA
jgi:predicted nucleic acid-binding protein